MLSATKRNAQSTTKYGALARWVALVDPEVADKTFVSTWAEMDLVTFLARCLVAVAVDVVAVADQLVPSVDKTLLQH
jgi:hypothetical protein